VGINEGTAPLMLVSAIEMSRKANNRQWEEGKVVSPTCYVPAWVARPPEQCARTYGAE